MNVVVSSGVSAFDRQPYCLITVWDDDGDLLGEGQLTPDQVRVLALDWLGAAEAAEADATVFGLMMDAADERSDPMAPERAAAFLAKMRLYREHLREMRDES